MKDYIASDEPRYYYPGAGDPLPMGGAKVLLLTRGGICVTGIWQNNGSYLAWSPMPKRDKAKEAGVETMIRSWAVMDGDCEG